MITIAFRSRHTALEQEAASLNPPRTSSNMPVGLGNITYPALGNLRLEEGTLEVWFTPVGELYPKLEAKQYEKGFSLFSFGVPDEFSVNAFWSSRGSQHRIGVSMNSSGDEALSPMWVALKNWQSGQRHHLALTWHGSDMRLVLDGTEAGTRMQTGRFSGLLGGQPLVIGGLERGRSDVIIHAVRTSSVARPSTLLKDAQPVADLYTLLLDRFDRSEELHGEVTTAEAAVIGSGGQLAGTYHFTLRPASGLALFGTASQVKNNDNEN